MSQQNTFHCDQCSKAGAGRFLPTGWINGVKYPVGHVKELDKTIWAITISMLPSDEDTVLMLTGGSTHMPLIPVTPHYLSERIDLCSAECVIRYIEATAKANAQVLDQRAQGQKMGRQFLKGFLRDLMKEPLELGDEPEKKS
jgi:hypothetical protein